MRDAFACLACCELGTKPRYYTVNQRHSGTFRSLRGCAARLASAHSLPNPSGAVPALSAPGQVGQLLPRALGIPSQLKPWTFSAVRRNLLEA